MQICKILHTFAATLKPNNMSKVTIKLRDGELEVPVICKVIKDGMLSLYWVESETCPWKAGDATIHYFYPSSFVGSNVHSSCHGKADFDGAVEITPQEWNKIVRKSYKEHLNDNLIPIEG